MTPPKLVARELRKRYGALEAVRGVSFEVQDCEVFGLLGPNGAGKTTTLECLLGLREPDGGEITICGIDARRHPREVKQRVGATLQTTALHAQITLREALALFGSFYRERADPTALLERFALADKADARFDTLSGGQKQRLALALAFVNRPELVVLDEPTAGLDPGARRELHGEVARMKRDGDTVLLTTHYIEEAEQLCDRVAVIDRGRIVATGTPRELVARSAAVPRVLLVAERPLDPQWFAGLPGVTDLTVNGAQAHFRAAHVNRTVAAVLQQLETHGVELLELEVKKASLEDVVLELGRSEHP